MVETFNQNPLLLLFLVLAIGYLVGNISIKGSKLGVAAVLFVGLFFGAMDQSVTVPSILFELGLVLFVYSIGLSSGKAFFKSFKKNGFRDLIFILIMLTLSGVVTIGIHFLFDFDAATTTGIYSGSTTNTSALAAVLEYINFSEISGGDSLIHNAVVAYSFTYPMGVIAAMIAIVLMEKWMKVDYKKEKTELKKLYAIDSDLTSQTIVITNENIVGITLRDLINKYEWQIVFGRMLQKNGETILPNWDSKFDLGDKIMAVGSIEDINNVTNILGESEKHKLSYDRSLYDNRRIFVSNPSVVGRELASLDLQRKYNTIVTRLRRGDVDLLVKSDTVLELGDRVRFVARRKELDSLSKYFGDSYFESSKANLFSFGLGIAIGILLGMVQFDLPGGISFKLGFAGGPLVVALILGTLGRTGPIVWTLPYSTNVTLRQIGLIMLLAVIGIRSGTTFINTFIEGTGFLVFIGGAIISFLTAILTIWIGYKFIKIPFSVLMGFVSNQPAVLEFAINRAGNKVPLIGFSLMFPISLIIKIVYAQILYIILSL